MRGSVAALLLAVLLAVPVEAGAAERTYGRLHLVEYVDNPTADRIVVNLSGLPPLFGEAIEVKLRGLDLPDINGRCEQETRLAEKARETVHWLLAKARHIELADVGRGRLFRLRATVLADGRDIRQVLINSKLAQPARSDRLGRDWCR